MEGPLLCTISSAATVIKVDRRVVFSAASYLFLVSFVGLNRCRLEKLRVRTEDCFVGQPEHLRLAMANKEPQLASVQF